MQTEFLRIYAPNSLHLLYHPIDTGSPSHDMSEHISLPSRRIVFSHEFLGIITRFC